MRKSALLLSLFALVLAVSGCVTIMPKEPKLTAEACKNIFGKETMAFRQEPACNMMQVFYRGEKNALIGVNSYGFDNNSGTDRTFWNYWLYVSDSDGNSRLVDKQPPKAPAIYEGSFFLRAAFISPEDEIYIEYTGDSSFDATRYYARINLDGSGRQSIDKNDYYLMSMRSLLMPREQFSKRLSFALGSRDYAEAERLRLERMDKLSAYLDTYVYLPASLSGEAKHAYDMLGQEKEKLQRVVGLDDPMLCQLREKYVVAINNDQYDDATKIFDLIERMERKYKAEPAQAAGQAVNIIQAGQAFPEKIVIEQKDAPSVGKQMRALSTVSAGLDGGMTSQQQNAWMSLIGLGDFIDASGSE